jgi:hypothetical protein
VGKSFKKVAKKSQKSLEVQKKCRTFAAELIFKHMGMIHDYTLPGEALSILGHGIRLMRADKFDEALELLGQAWEILNEYMASDNMVEDDEDEEASGDDEGETVVDLERLMVLPMEIINLTRGDELAQVITSESMTRSFVGNKVKRHSSVKKALAHLEAKGFTINNDAPWR